MKAQEGTKSGDRDVFSGGVRGGVRRGMKTDRKGGNSNVTCLALGNDEESLRVLITDGVTGLEVRIPHTALITAGWQKSAPSEEPVAWMTHESLWRLKDGGNCKGAVPVHGKRSVTAKIPLYAHPAPSGSDVT